MKELSLHILDIIQNSVNAGASIIEIEIEEEEKEDIFRFSVKDNGCGMSADFLRKVKDPFTTTRTTRKTGLGIPLLEAAAVQCGGRLDIVSEPGKGTAVTAVFQNSHIDRAPLGDMAQTMVTVISGSPEIDFLYTHIKNGQSFVFQTEDLRRVLQGVPLDTPEIIGWIEEAVREGLAEIQVK
ncbi:ATP-binding protein [Acetivibrio sp. MSJd-27]|uniref:ATP-binding protein n=1 Tax=Acetivibrio sp. MSJd-27 TaxID=2841523 RepID=UPI001C11B91F|nr:ATP-binding protein [Acetivibrio sp. MSJd-27]MBU5450340.1 ATP-binding protein [Acetivibrio sp. MSJd-27]